MNDHTLRPPNSQWLSDEVIGDVIHAQRPSRRLLVSSVDGASRNLLHPTETLSTFVSATVPTPLVTLSKSIPNSKSLLRPKRSVAALSKAQKEQPDDEVERRRERNRLHQARHKLKQNKRVTDLESSIRHLKDEIQELKLKRQLIAHGVPTSPNIWGVAAEFFRLFRHSVRPTINDLGSAYYTQKQFLFTTMASNVTDGSVSGVDALLETWVQQSLCYEEIDLQPVRMENGPGNVLVATTRGLLTINENTLRFAFPHLINDGKWSALAVRMLGQRLKLRGSVQFTWDSESGRVTCVECKADIFTPLLSQLGSLVEVSCVFDKARLSPEGRLVVGSDIEVP